MEETQNEIIILEDGTIIKTKNKSFFDYPIMTTLPERPKTDKKPIRKLEINTKVNIPVERIFNCIETINFEQVLDNTDFPVGKEQSFKRLILTRDIVKEIVKDIIEGTLYTVFGEITDIIDTDIERKKKIKAKFIRSRYANVQSEHLEENTDT